MRSSNMGLKWAELSHLHIFGDNNAQGPIQEKQLQVRAKSEKNWLRFLSSYLSLFPLKINFQLISTAV